MSPARSRARWHVSISGQIPLAELDDYQGRLKSLTGGKGSYSIDLLALRPGAGPDAAVHAGREQAQ
jgi:translation elongation factor EF-G